jgi:hypothetical protein
VTRTERRSQITEIILAGENILSESEKLNEGTVAKAEKWNSLCPDIRMHPVVVEPEQIAAMVALEFEEECLPLETIFAAHNAAARLAQCGRQALDRDTLKLAVLDRARDLRCKHFARIIEDNTKGDGLLFALAHADTRLKSSIGDAIDALILDTVRIAILVGDKEFPPLAQFYFGLGSSLAHRDQMALFFLPFLSPGITPERRRLEILTGLYDRGYITKAVRERIKEASRLEPIVLGGEEVGSLEMLTGEACSVGSAMPTDQAVIEEELLADVYGRDGLDSEELRFVEARLEGKPWAQAAAELGWDQRRADRVKKAWQRDTARVALPSLPGRVKIGDMKVPEAALERVAGGPLIWQSPR